MEPRTDDTSASSTTPKGHKKFKALSLDGGGICGLSELTILGEMMQRVEVDTGAQSPIRPCEYFDLIGGTGTGGLIAILLGRLGMTVKEAKDAYVAIGQKSLPQISDKSGLFRSGKKPDPRAFESMIQDLVTRILKDSDAKMKSGPKGQHSCNVFVCAMPAAHVGEPRLFRSYSVPRNDDYDLMIWQAARVTNASAHFLERFQLGEPIAEEFVEAGISCNNPVEIVLEEAEALLGPGRKPDVIISLGSGNRGVIGLPSPDKSSREIMESLKRIAEDCQVTANRFARNAELTVGVYHRFEVAQGMQKILLDEWNKLGEVETHTKAYLSGFLVGKEVDKVVSLICEDISQKLAVDLT